MASWHPPIPAGKLYSDDAIKLGPALAMLAWCYDGVQRDGTIEVSIEKAARDLNKPYRTVKDWWHLLRIGPFFSKATDKGRRGWVVTMANEWLDWHVMSNNYPVQGQETALESEGQEVAHDNLQVPVKARSRTGKGRNSALKTSAYKEDHIDHKTEDHSRADRAPSEHSRLMALYAEALPDNRIPNGAQEGKAAKAILAAGYTPEQAMQVYQYLKRRDFYADQHLSLATVNKQMGAVLDAIKRGVPSGRRNGHQPSAAFEKAKISFSDLDKGF